MRTQLVKSIGELLGLRCVSSESRVDCESQNKLPMAAKLGDVAFSL